MELIIAAGYKIEKPYVGPPLPMIADAITLIGHASYLASLKKREFLKPDIASAYQSNRPEFTPCNVKGRIGGKPEETVVDFGCKRTLVHKRFVNEDRLTGDKITAAGEQLIIPLAWVEFESEQGRPTKLVGVLDKLPFDCLLGRSSFGQTLSKKNVLEQKERNTADPDRGGVDTFALTQRQKALENTQKRSDEMVDRENSVANKTLSKKETRKIGLTVSELPTLFEDKEPIETVENTEESGMENLAFNILDRDRSQLIKDQAT